MHWVGVEVGGLNVSRLSLLTILIVQTKENLTLCGVGDLIYTQLAIFTAMILQLASICDTAAPDR